MLGFSNPTKIYAPHLITTSQKLSQFQSEKQGEGFARGLGRRAQFSPSVQQGMSDFEVFRRRSSREWRLELVWWRSSTGWRLELVRQRSREQGIVLC
jgi:hypothetical protein